jgi:segregation and condensation protein A
MEQALERMRGMLGTAIDWTRLAAWLPSEWAVEPARRRSATAASFAAALELVKDGRLQLRQDGAFQPIWIRQATAEDVR